MAMSMLAFSNSLSNITELTDSLKRFTSSKPPAPKETHTLTMIMQRAEQKSIAVERNALYC